MRVFMNFREVRGAYGGANAFLRTLRRELIGRGVSIVADPAAADVALLNALTNDIDRAFVERVAARTPVVHRKVGYRVSGSPEMRRVVDGTVWGDRLQLEFTPFVSHTIFQSDYSRSVFEGEGFQGTATTIRNGVDDHIFNMTVRRAWRRRPQPRPLWDGRAPLEVVISTWSMDQNKGFDDYAQIDAALPALPHVRVTLVGRSPVRFRHIRMLHPRGTRGLAAVLKRAHVILQLARHETCSNALLEGLSCGLPAIYLDSGSNAEVAGPYGVAYEGDVDGAVAAITDRYGQATEALREQPFRIGPVADRYLAVLENVAAARQPS
jgi:glycosyltransferase involved in cell wall biosynthesis